MSVHTRSSGRGAKGWKMRSTTIYSTNKNSRIRDRVWQDIVYAVDIEHKIERRDREVQDLVEKRAKVGDI